MKKSHRKIVRRHNVRLIDDMEPEPVTRYLYQMHILNQEDKESILSLRPNRHDMNEDLLSKLTRRGPQAFPKFVEGLEKNQPFLACILLRDENSVLFQKQAEKDRELTERKLTEKKLLDLMKRESALKNEKQEKVEELEKRVQELGNELTKAENEKRDLYNMCNHFEQQLMVGRSSSHGNSASSAELRGESGFQEELFSPVFDEQRSEFQQRKDSSMNGPEQRLENSTRLRQSRRVANELSSLQQENRTSTQISERKSSHKMVFSYENDFDKKGVIHYLGSKAGLKHNESEWLNPARVPSSGVIVTCSNGHGTRGDPRNILEYFNPGNSYTDSWWCVDLGEKYTLLLTHYTLRQIGRSDGSFLQKWELQGRLSNADNWESLQKHRRFDWSKEPFSYIMTTNGNVPCKTKTWPIRGEAKPFRFFKVGRIEGETYPLTFKMSLAGIELYGVLKKHKLC